MLPLILAMLAADPAAARFEACAKLVAADPVKAVAEADSWRVAGGGLPARQCLGLAYVAQERWAPAAAAFEQAAREAEIQRDGRAAALWVQAGNASLAGADPAKARQQFDRALALPVMSDAMRGEAHLDRARAAVESNDMLAARVDLDKALALVPGDPMAWLLSAALARRQGDKPRAAKDIANARRLAPTSPDIADEAARIAAH
jgi:tetratricopeptide (TPR) repeat protein